MPTLVITCENCGDSVTKYIRPSQLVRGEGKYCSRGCAGTANAKLHRVRVSTKCEFCGRVFQHKRRRKRKYCSVDCSRSGKAVQNTVVTRCASCKTVFSYKKWAIKKGETRKYCSVVCASKQQKHGRERPLLSERMTKDGVMIKLETGWVLKARYVLEQMEGRIDIKSCRIIYLDGNKANCSLENLVLVPNKPNTNMCTNCKKLFVKEEASKFKFCSSDCYNKYRTNRPRNFQRRPKVTTKKRWQTLLEKLTKLEGDTGAILYDRIKILVELWEDEEFKEAMATEGKDAEEELKSRIKTTCVIPLTLLREMLKDYPKRNQWSKTDTDLYEMRTKTLERINAHSRRATKKKAKSQKGDEPEPKQHRKVITQAQYEEAKVEAKLTIDQLTMENRYLKEQIDQLKEQNTFLQKQLDKMLQPVG